MREDDELHGNEELRREPRLQLRHVRDASANISGRLTVRSQRVARLRNLRQLQKPVRDFHVAGRDETTAREVSTASHDVDDERVQLALKVRSRSRNNRQSVRVSVVRSGRDGRTDERRHQLRALRQKLLRVGREDVGPARLELRNLLRAEVHLTEAVNASLVRTAADAETARRCRRVVSDRRVRVAGRTDVELVVVQEEMVEALTRIDLDDGRDESSFTARRAEARKRNLLED